MPTLDWLNRAAAFTTAAKVPYRLLEQVSVHTSSTSTATSVTSENATNLIAIKSINTLATAKNNPELISVRPEPVEGSQASTSSARTGVFDNLLIQGDNLEALKALLPFYRGQVKCIFIDPPYNTKSAFEHYDDNLEHAQWLTMMLPRLQLLRELLSEDGSIWVTIDDNEGHYLKVMMDEVFGRGNFVANVVWQSSDNSNNDAKTFSIDHNQMLVYSRSSGWLTNKLDAEEKRSHFKNPDEDPRGPWFDGNPLNSPKPRENLMYNLTAPNGNVIRHPPNGWRWELETMQEKMSSGEIRFNTAMSGIKRRTYLLEMKGLPPSSLWTDLLRTGHNRQAKSEQKALGILINNDLFDTPKPEKLLEVILNTATNQGDLVLDSFLGSGTTAAVAHKMGRRWIGIEMGEHAATHCLPRLQKVLDGEQGGISKAVNWGVSTLDKPWSTERSGGFRFMRLGETVFDQQGRINPAVRFATLAAFIWQQESNTALDLDNSVPATPHLGTHYKFNSYLSNKYAGYSKNSPLKQGETGDLAFDTVRPELIEGFAGASTSSARTEGDAARTELDAPQPPEGTAYYLLFNGILKDKRPASGNVLTREVLAALLALHSQVAASAQTLHPGVKLTLTVYGEACRIGPERLKQAGVTFKHIPYDVKAR